MTTEINSNMFFFLGGQDAEMLEIRRVLEQHSIPFCDKQLGWGANSSAYAEEIAAAVAAGSTVVTVELGLDMMLPCGSIVVDHHNEMSDRPASLLQVLDLLGLEPSHWQQLIAANDCGYIPAMLAQGATAEEVAAVRLADRSAQGITPEQEAEAEKAISCREVVNGVTVVRMAHSKTATVCDRLFSEGEEQRLLILSEDGEANFFGDIAVRQPLFDKFGGWLGGSPEGNGYWGCGHRDSSWNLLPNWKELQADEELFVVNFYNK